MAVNTNHVVMIVRKIADINDPIISALAHFEESGLRMCYC